MESYRLENPPREKNNEILSNLYNIQWYRYAQQIKETSIEKRISRHCRIIGKINWGLSLFPYRRITD